jgi:hypothetical protein
MSNYYGDPLEFGPSAIGWGARDRIVEGNPLKSDESALHRLLGGSVLHTIMGNKSVHIVVPIEESTDGCTAPLRAEDVREAVTFTAVDAPLLQGPTTQEKPKDVTIFAGSHPISEKGVLVEIPEHSVDTFRDWSAYLATRPIADSPWKQAKLDDTFGKKVAVDKLRKLRAGQTEAYLISIGKEDIGSLGLSLFDYDIASRARGVDTHLKLNFEKPHRNFERLPESEDNKKL